MPQLCGDGYLIAGDSAMLFNALHREGSNMAITSGRYAANTILEAFDKGDFSRNGLKGYPERLQSSYIIKDLKKYRRFNSFRLHHHEFFTLFPKLSGFAAREMLTVDGVSKKDKQRAILKKMKEEFSIFKMLRIVWGGIRSVK
jgi:electron transfer flavoprotein-quinone oxidoreductase